MRAKANTMNSGLKEILDRMARGGGSYPVYQGRIVFLDLGSVPFLPEYMSADCFHPGKLGHEVWANLMWKKLNEQNSTLSF
jgi:lysophospholipase L1-like esterase